MILVVSVLIVLAISCARASFPDDASFLNDFDQPMTFTCPSGNQVVSNIYSVHDNGAEDRRFKMACRDIGSNGQATCAWTANFVNDFDRLVDFECSGNGFISGMSSEHSNAAEDRRWKFYCCHIGSVHLEDCERSGHTNFFDQVQNYEVPHGKAIKGVISEHDNGAEDRWYEYDICTVTENKEPIVG